MNDTPKIIQLLMTPQDSTWQNSLLGLGSDGVTYRLNSNGFWEAFVPPLDVKKGESLERRLIRDLERRLAVAVDACKRSCDESCAAQVADERAQMKNGNP